MGWLDRGERVDYDRVHWGITACRLIRPDDDSECNRGADLLYDYDGRNGTGIPACVDCVDLLTERQETRAAFPSFEPAALRPW